MNSEIQPEVPQNELRKVRLLRILSTAFFTIRASQNCVVVMSISIISIHSLIANNSSLVLYVVLKSKNHEISLVTSCKKFQCFQR